MLKVTFLQCCIASTLADQMVVALFKQGVYRVCSNYRGITLNSFPGKVCASVLEKRFVVDPRIQEEG